MAPERSYQRPSERVLQYFQNLKFQDGARLPPTRVIAKALNVSHSTVHKALQKLERQGRAKLKVGDGSFLFPTPRTLRISIAWVPHGNSEGPQPWKEALYGGILSAVTEARNSVTIVPLSADPKLSLSEKLLKVRGVVDGVILFWDPEMEEVRRVYEAEGKAVIFAGLPSLTATSNFVAPNDFVAFHKLGSAWKASGRKHIFYLTAILPGRPGELLRLGGLLSGFGDPLGESKSFRRVVLAQGTEADGLKAVKRQLEKKHRFDALFCSTPALAMGALAALKKARLKVPKDVSLVVGASLFGPAPAEFTSIESVATQMGKKSLQLLQRRLLLGDSSRPDLPSESIPLSFQGGASTLPMENKVLEIER